MAYPVRASSLLDTPSYTRTAEPSHLPNHGDFYPHPKHCNELSNCAIAQSHFVPPFSSLDGSADREAVSVPVTSSAQPELQSKTAEHPPTGIIRSLRREAAKKKAEDFKQERKQRLKEEKRRKKWLGGVAWGFDPIAGMLSSQEPNEAHGGCYVSAGRTMEVSAGADEVDDVGRRTGRRWLTHSLWGVEKGGPGREGKYGHGSLRSTQTESNGSVFKKPRSPSPWRQDSGQ